MELYDYGEFLLILPSGFKIPKVGWNRKAGLEPATEEQQTELMKLGWGRDNSLSKNGAKVVIQSIKED